MRAYAQPPRKARSSRYSGRNPSSPATSRRAHPAYPCTGHAEQAPRKTPENLASPTSLRTRNRWSGTCTPARGARQTSGLGGGGSGPSSDFGPQTRRNCWSRRLPYAPPERLRYSTLARVGECPEKRAASKVDLPRPPDCLRKYTADPVRPRRAAALGRPADRFIEVSSEPNPEQG